MIHFVSIEILSSLHIIYFQSILFSSLLFPDQWIFYYKYIHYTFLAKMLSVQSILISLFAFTSLVLASPIPTKAPQDLQFVHKQNEKRFYDYDNIAGNNNEPIRGVNIGGWLVLEPYITPSLFEVFRTNQYNDNGIPADEYHYCEYLGYEVAQNRLTNHWDTFYQEQDFANIASQGFNLVRIPIGYWAFKTLDNDPYITGQQEAYLDKAIQWAANHGLKVWVDLHGAAGSQNGFDNSGLRDTVTFLDDDNLAVTTSVLNYLLEKYSKQEYLETVIGIELINEPLGPVLDMDKLKNNYVLPAYEYIRNNLQSDQIIIVHDAFQPYNYWDDVLSPDSGAWGVVIDHHHYQVFSPGELSRQFNDKINVACEWGTGLASESHWTVAGEFSAALTDCSKWLNGVGIGARYDGSFVKDDQTSYWIGTCEGNEDINAWSEERKANTRKYVEAQLDAFEMRGGWIIWCYKTETSIEWDVSRLIYNGLFPQPLNARQYPGQCSSSS